MLKTIKFTLLIFVLLYSSSSIFSQDYVDTTRTPKTVPTVTIKTKDGTRLRGKIIKNDGKTYTIETQNLGTVSIPSENVMYIQQNDYQAVTDKNEMFVPLSNTAYLANQSGYNLKQGEIRYTNIYIISNSFHFGLSNNLSANIGFITVSPTVINVGAKYTFKTSEKIRFGLSGTYIFSSGFANNIGFGAIGAVGTFGTDTKNISVGATWGTSRGNIFSGRPVFQLSGITRVSRRVALTMDNLLTTTERSSFSSVFSPTGGFTQINTKTVFDGGISYGIRLLYPRTQLDLGMFRPIYDFGTTAFPLGPPYFKLTTALNRKK
jgi:hypothetical protein